MVFDARCFSTPSMAMDWCAPDAGRPENLSFVMLGLVPSICEGLILLSVADSRHKAEDEGAGGVEQKRRISGDTRRSNSKIAAKP
jgi:hypothetical protein